jgi:hypothetical protein
MTMHHVYHLVDPRDRAVRYVGKTGNPKSRLSAHIQEARERQNTAKKQWIAELLAAGLEPLLIIAASVPDEATARVIESAHCKQHISSITNIHDPAKGAKDLERVKT